MTYKVLIGAILLSIFGVGSALAENSHHQKGHGPDPVLPAGAYSARVKAMTCQSCAPLIEKTLRNMKEMGPVHVDTKESRVHFSVKPGSSVKWSAIQSTLRKAADQMGMGADFTLSDFQASPSKASPPSPDQSLLSGYYDAKVGAIVCGGCKGLIEQTMRSVDGIGAAQVDEKKGTVRFAVMAGKSVQLSKLQAALKSAAETMGMGADYSLSELKPVKKN